MASSQYVKPVAGTFKRLDQGIDIQGKPGDPVVAMGLARVEEVKPNPGGFGTTIIYRLMDGPMRGREIYVGHAQPDVHVGQLLQAGDQVATLLEHPLGNATQPGWLETGFAKNGVPQPGSAKEFQRFFNSAGDASAASPAAPASPADTSSTAATLAPPVAGQDPQLGAAPTTDSTQPLEPPPGSGMTSTNSYLFDLWNRIASQPGASPDSQALAANAQLLAGG